MDSQRLPSAIGFSASCFSNPNSGNENGDAGAKDATSSASADGPVVQPSAPPRAGLAQGGAYGLPDGGDGGSLAMGTCSAGECVGNDGYCYGPCPVGSCAQVLMATNSIRERGAL